MSNEKQIYLSNGMPATLAQYHSFGLEEYDENPFIQALPPICNKEEVIKKLSLGVTFNEAERALDSSLRMHLIQRLYKFYQPLPVHMEVWNMVSTMIKQGYLAKNPFNRDYIRYQHIVGGAIANKTFEVSTQDCFRTTSSTGILIGHSGMGKTTTVNRVLNNIPQVIVHNEYEGQEFSRMQLTWLKLEAPHNASIKALCLQYFMKIDELMGTNNFKLYVSQRLSTDAMLPLMGKVGQNVGLGLLVIDELQHLVGSNLNKVMNYFVTLINSFGIPVLFIGTPASYPVFQTEFRIARRITGHGEVIWNNMKKDAVFHFFLQSIWKYQWTKEYVPLTQDIRDLFYEETQGVSDLIIKLFVNTQYQAIVSGTEKISIALIKKVAKQTFRALQPMLEAIKSQNPYKMAKYDDIKSMDTTFIDKTIEVNRKETDEKPEKIEKNDKKTKEIKKTVQKKVRYGEIDLRRFYLQAKQQEEGVYDLLLQGNHIDKMDSWCL